MMEFLQLASITENSSQWAAREANWYMWYPKKSPPPLFPSCPRLIAVWKSQAQPSHPTMVRAPPEAAQEPQQHFSIHLPDFKGCSRQTPGWDGHCCYTKARYKTLVWGSKASVPGVAQTFVYVHCICIYFVYGLVWIVTVPQGWCRGSKDKSCSGQCQPGGTSRELCPAAKGTGVSRGAASHIQSTASKRQHLSPCRWGGQTLLSFSPGTHRPRCLPGTPRFCSVYSQIFRGIALFCFKSKTDFRLNSFCVRRN